MIKIDNTVISSLSQTIYDTVDELLKEYQSLNPLFKYSLAYGINYDEDTPADTFNVALELGTVNRQPAHYTTIKKGEYEIPVLPFAGTVDVALSILNPVSIRYTNEVPFTTFEQKTINDDYSDQSSTNYVEGDGYEILDKLSEDKIESSYRLLEGLSLFLYRKGLIKNNFELTFITDIPMITGVLERGEFRLTNDIMIACKFQDTTYFTMDSGETIDVWFKLNDNWEKFYQPVDFSFEYGAVDTDYPVSPKAITQNIQNQMMIEATLTSPALSMKCANTMIADLFDLAQLEKLQNVEMKFTRNGKDWKHTRVNIKTFDRPLNVDTFGTYIYGLKVVEPITDYTGD